jgi:hypothetical protein
LAPWIKKLKELRAHAPWHDATYHFHDGKKYDILSKFTMIKDTIIKKQAVIRWTAENKANSLKPEHSEVFYARILGKVVVSSITDDFYTTLQNYSDKDTASNGPLILWLTSILSHLPREDKA